MRVLLRSCVISIMGAGLLATSTAGAQQPDTALTRPASRMFAGASLVLAQPQGEFANYVETGFGITGHFLYQLDREGILGLRVDGGFLNYGSETMRVPLSRTVGGRILVDVTTSNNIFIVGAGPQLMMPRGRLRPYLNGSVGAAYFVTESSVEGTDDEEPFARTTHFDDWTFAYGGGAGLYIPVRGGPQPISIDLGVRYRSQGETRYLREGSISDEVGGGISFTPIASETDLLTFHVGVSVGVSVLPDDGR